jgi:negative modulator of initiation of replication
MTVDQKRVRDLLAYVASPRFLVQGTEISRYLAVLAFLYRQHAEDFEAVLQMRGKQRVYFGQSAEQIEKVSVHTFPQRIEGSPFWALTNLNLRQKQAILGQVLFALGYSADVEQRVVAALDQPSRLKRLVRGLEL